MATRLKGDCKDDGQSEFIRPFWTDTVTLVIEDSKLTVSRHILSVLSPAFDAMFDFRKLQGNEEDEIQLPGKKYADMLEFMRCIYPDIEKPVTRANFLDIMPLASEYHVKGIYDKCVKILHACLKYRPKKPDLFKYLIIASQYHIDEAKDLCLEFGARLNRKEVTETEETVLLPADLKIELQDRRIKYLEEYDPEIDIFDPYLVEAPVDDDQNAP